MIYDVFPFFNELELLDIRLNVHAPYVDRFILVEAHRTHSGNPKPLHFDQHRDAFSKFSNRLTHVICNYEGREAGTNEMIQRNAALPALGDFKDDDIIVHSDLDEIVDFSKLGPVDGIYQLEQKMYHYYLNLLRGGWDFGKIFRGSDLRRIGNFHQMRHHRTDHDWSRQAVFRNAGWHFSFMGGAARVKEKLEAYLHQEFNQPHLTNLESLRDRIEKQQDVLCRGEREGWWMKKVEINQENHPQYVVENQARFADLILS